MIRLFCLGDCFKNLSNVDHAIACTNYSDIRNGREGRNGRKRPGTPGRKECKGLRDVNYDDEIVMTNALSSASVLTTGAFNQYKYRRTLRQYHHVRSRE